MSKYVVHRADIENLVGDVIFTELTGHLTKSKTVSFPDRFIVVIDLESENEDEIIRYFNTETETDPFLVMGMYDVGVYATIAMFKSVGKSC